MNDYINTLSPDFRHAIGQKTVSEVLLEAGELVAVSAKELFHDGAYDFTLQEYEDSAGNVRVSNLFVPQGLKSPKWHIKTEAANYLEEHIVMAGKGWLRIFDETDNVVSETRLDLDHIAENDFPRIIQPGDTFQVEADLAQNARLQRLGMVSGVMVCAIFRRAPFDISFEERVE